jgi:hypothetical protein
MGVLDLTVFGGMLSQDIFLASCLVSGGTTHGRPSVHAHVHPGGTPVVVSRG